MSFGGGPFGGAPFGGELGAGTVSGATAITLSGPTSGAYNVASTNFTVGANGLISGSITVTPYATSGTGGFTPSSVVISSGSQTATFAFTPTSTGARNINVTNSSTLTAPADITYTVPTPSLTLSGPSSGTINAASNNFTITLNNGTGSVIFSPTASAGAGSFTPTSKTLTLASPSGTFTYTPTSLGARNINGTSSPTTSGPSDVAFTATTDQVTMFRRTPYLTTDTLGTKSVTVYDADGVLVSSSASFIDIGDITNAWWVEITVTPNGAYGDFYGYGVFANVNSANAAIELYYPPTTAPASLVICKLSKFLVSDTIGTPGYKLYTPSSGYGSTVTTGIVAVSGVTNKYAAKITLTPDTNYGAVRGMKWIG